MEFTPILRTLSSLFPRSISTKKNPTPFKIMIISPHPDDECIMSSLALRLQLENKAKVTNIAVTLGSKKERKKERLSELKKACKELQFNLEVLSDNWDKKLPELIQAIKKNKPDLIIAPHLYDGHETHIKTAKLVKEAIGHVKKFSAIIAWSEYWAQLKKPNLLIEVPTDILTLQIKALLNHEGEIKRNPYHLRLPGWMMDNVRRGAEVIKQNNREAPQIPFGMIYHLQFISNGKYKDLNFFPYLSSDQDIGQIFKFIFEAASESKIKVK